MASINIGSLKFNWKGTYNGSTAYAIDDVTEYNGSSYICILASTGNLPTNTTYFQPMATKGTDGTDVGTTLTTQGDILYRDGSGLARLGYGTNGQVLTTGGSGANPSWGTVSSDFVKLATQALDATGASSFEFQNVFSAANDALYGGYHLSFYHQTTSNNGLDVRFLRNTNTEITDNGHYKYFGIEGYRQTNQNNNVAGAASDGDGTDKMPWDGWGQNGADNGTEGGHYVANFQGAIYGGTNQNRGCIVTSSLRDSSSPNYGIGKLQAFRYEGTYNITGLKFYLASGNLINGQCTLWGLKK